MILNGRLLGWMPNECNDQHTEALNVGYSNSSTGAPTNWEQLVAHSLRNKRRILPRQGNIPVKSLINTMQISWFLDHFSNWTTVQKSKPALLAAALLLIFLTYVWMLRFSLVHVRVFSDTNHLNLPCSFC